jgi:hypothetical protein
VGALLERDRKAYADALHAERASAATAHAAAEAAHAEGVGALRTQLEAAHAAVEAAAATSAAHAAAERALADDAGELRLELERQTRAHEAMQAELAEARTAGAASSATCAAASAELAALRERGDATNRVLRAVLVREVRSLEGEAHRAKEDEGVARAARAHSEQVGRTRGTTHSNLSPNPQPDLS